LLHYEALLHDLLRTIFETLLHGTIAQRMNILFKSQSQRVVLWCDHCIRAHLRRETTRYGCISSWSWPARTLATDLNQYPSRIRHPHYWSPAVPESTSQSPSDCSWTASAGRDL